MQSSQASRMILDAKLSPDGVWRVVPTTRNQARAQAGLPPVDGNDLDVDWAFIDGLKIDYEEITKRFWRYYYSGMPT